MLSICPISDLEYYLELCSADYFLSGGEPPGKWLGGATELLGVAGQVQREDFVKIFKGFHPNTGEKLVQNAGSSGRRPGFDLTFSAPKSISLMWALAGREDQEKLQQMQLAAVGAALDFAERHLAYSRTGKAGSGELKKVRLAVASFEHGTSRAEDPQLHTHALIANVGIDEAGKARSLLSPPLFNSKKLLGAYYRAEYARMLRQEYGLRVERRGDSYDIVGVDRRALDHFSKRRKEILAKIGKNASAKEAAVAVLETRRTKENVPPRSELMERWRAEYAQLQAEEPSLPDCSIEALRLLAGDLPPVDLPRMLTESSVKLLSKASHFSAEDFFFEALCAAPEFALDPQAAVQAAKRFLETSKELIRLDLPDGSFRYTSPKTLQDEKRLLDTTLAMRQRTGAVTSPRIVARTLKRSSHLNEEQSAAVEGLLGNESSIRFLHGLAGTGKTSFVLKACVEAWQRQGFEVIGSAPTGRAAVELEESAGISTETNHALLGDYQHSTGFVAGHHLKQLVRAAKGKRTYGYKKPAPHKFHSKQILIVDEASMVNLRHFQMLLDAAQKGGATIVFVGDPNQLAPVEGTAPFLSLSHRCGYAKLQDIRRQRDAWARDAAKHFAKGEPGKALALYAERKQIRVRDDREQAIRQMVLDWTGEGLRTPERAVILCSTNADCQTANALCQQKAIEVGWIDPRVSVTVEDRQKDGQVFESTIHVHDRILFTRNSKKYGVQNGTLGVVTALDARARKMAVRLDNGKTVLIPLRKFSHVRLGYALTTHRSQGATFEHAYVLAGDNMQDLPAAYVQATRARERTTFYGTKNVIDAYLENVEDSPLARQMSRRPDLTMAADLLPPPAAVDQDRDSLLAKLVDDYLKSTDQANKAMILTRNASDADYLNQMCHERLALNSTSIKTASGIQVTVGDRVTFSTPPYLSSINKGERATVAGIDPVSGRLSLVFDAPKPLQEQKHFNVPAQDAQLQLAHAQTLDSVRQSVPQVQSLFNLQDNSNSPVSFDYYSQSPTSLSPSSFGSPPLTQPVRSTWADDYTQQYNYLYQGAGSNYWAKQMHQTNQQFETFTQTQAQTQYQSYAQANAMGQSI